MNAVTVTLPGLLNACAGGASELTVQAATLQGALDELLRQAPLLRVHLFDQDGAQRQHVMILYNDQSLRWLDTFDIPTKPGDRIAILQLVSGG